MLLRSPGPISPDTYSGHIRRRALCPNRLRNGMSQRSSSSCQSDILPTMVGPSKSRPPMSHRKTDLGIPCRSKSAKVVLVAGAEAISAATPVPTQIVSNGEYLPPPQSETQKRVERRMLELDDVNSKRVGLSRRQFMQTSCGMAAAFLAMNEIYGNVFQVEAAEAHEPELMLARAQSLAGQFVFDVQTHFVRDDFKHEELLGLASFASEHWNPKMKEEGVSSLARYKFQNYVKEIYYDSDTSLALLSGAPFDDPSWWLLSNEQIVKAREII